MKKINRSNFRVEVYPKTSVYGIQVAEEKDICETIIADVKRHVNDVQTAIVAYDSYPVCAHCGSQWTETGIAYNGGCCKKDQEEEDARTANTTGQARGKPSPETAGSAGGGK